jgi:hypothetical protein
MNETRPGERGDVGGNRDGNVATDLGSSPLSRRCSPPSATGRICAGCGNPLAVALAALVARGGQLLVAFRPLPWSAFPGEPPAVGQAPGAGQQRRHTEPEQQGVLEPGRAAAAGGGCRGGEQAGAGSRAVDRFPPPAVVVLTDDLCAVSRHTGRAII